MQVGPATIPAALAAVMVASTVAVAVPGDIVEDALEIEVGRGVVGLESFVGSIGSPGDLNGDGVDDMVVGSPFGGQCGRFRGSVSVVFLGTDGVPLTDASGWPRIGAFTAGFDEALTDFDYFGGALADLGDLDGDGRPELAVGAPGDREQRGFFRGAVWILSLDPDGSVHRTRKIGDQIGGFRGVLDSSDAFGSALASLGDVDGDGVTDLAVGAPGDDADRASGNSGAVWVLLMNADASVKGWQKIDGSPRSLGKALADGDRFGSAVAGIADVDGDGVPDLAVGSPFDDQAGRNSGAAWVVLLNADGSPKSTHKITAGRAGFDRVLDDHDRFAAALANVGDLDGDGIAELAVGTPGDDDGDGMNPDAEVGAVWFLFLGPDANVRFSVKASATRGGFPAPQPKKGALGSAIGAVAERVIGIGALRQSVGNLNLRIGTVWRTVLGGGTAAVCGDGSVAGLEECDDGGTQDGDGCTTLCRTSPGFTCAGSPSVCEPTCGDGTVDAGDECDDGELASGDGCDAVCRVEKNYFCSGEPSACATGTTTTTTMSTTTTMPPTVCGNGDVETYAEGCDDGNLVPGDGCDEFCEIEAGWDCSGSPSNCMVTCGDGVIDCREECDDGNLVSDDGCGVNCIVEPDYSCTHQPSVCSLCSDGVIGPSERCDDGNLDDGDGCDARCKLEDGWTCTGEPSQCTRFCGDAVLEPGEECDDGNVVDGDGCTQRCVIEEKFKCVGEPSVCKRNCGDGNGDDVVTATDALLALRVAVGRLGAAEQCLAVFCDVNGDGQITAVDALLILRKAVGLSVTLACPL